MLSEGRRGSRCGKNALPPNSQPILTVYSSVFVCKSSNYTVRDKTESNLIISVVLGCHKNALVKKPQSLLNLGL